MGQKAGETARLLKAGLLTIRQELAAVDTELERVATEQRVLDGARGRVAQSLAARQSAQTALDVARTQQAQLMGLRQQSQGIEVRRAELQRECDQVAHAGTQAIEALKAQDQGEQQRLERLQQRIAQRVTQAQNRRQTLRGQRNQCLAILTSEPAVRRSAHRLPMAEQVLAARAAQLDLSRQLVQRLTRCQGLNQTAEHKLAAIEREAGQAALKAEELALRFGLTWEVPCVGSELQGRCKVSLRQDCLISAEVTA